LEVIQESAAVRIELQSLPACVTLVRALLSAVGERFELEPELVDDLKTAVSEACNNVVIHAYPHAPGTLVVELDVEPDALRVAVIDRGEGIRHAQATADRMGVGLAVISALADRAEFQSVPGGGTVVRMSFSARGRPIAVTEAVLAPGGSAPALTLAGDVLISVAPVGLLGEILGRVARALAAGAQFSLDRFSDLYLITDEIAAHVRTAAVADQVSCALSATAGRLEIVIGPFRPGTMSALIGGEERNAYSFAKLVDELTVEEHDEGELLRAVVIDRR
jgi:serine/threonine-protein kinase RsbW